MTWPLMNSKEMHAFGIQLILPYIQKEGFEIKEINVDIGQNPQVISYKDDQLAFIFVRTECFPGKGNLTEDQLADCVNLSTNSTATPYFASVGLCLAAFPDKTSVKSKAEWSLPVRNGGFYIAYNGLEKMN
jgi:hypothetical protein